LIALLVGELEFPFNGNSITGTIVSNVITGTTSGFNFSGPVSVTATSNTIQGVIAIDRGGSTIKGNRIDAQGGNGVQLSDPGTNIVEMNTIVNSSVAVYGCSAFFFILPASGDTVTSNTILNAAVGVEMPSGNTVTPNTIKLTAAATQACP
jgi:hypothetical protein